MKLLNRDEFLKLPVGTMYAICGDCEFSKIYVKGVANNQEFDFLPFFDIKPNDEQTYFDAFDNFTKTKKCELDFETCMVDDGVAYESYGVFTAKELSEMTKLLQVGLRLAINTEKQANAVT